MTSSLLLTALGAGVALAMTAGSALAAVPLYATPGSENPTTYSFTATNTGDIDAYFAGSTAQYHETLTMLVNGVSTGIVGLDDHTSSVGQMLDLGHVEAGATITFAINVLTTGNTWFSDGALNSDGANHIFSAAYAGGDNGLPAGTYVAFEDMSGGHSDWNYHDETFVFTDVSTVTTQPGSPPSAPISGPDSPPAPPSEQIPSAPASVGAVPEPQTWALMLIGFGGLGASLRTGRRTKALAAGPCQSS